LKRKESKKRIKKSIYKLKISFQFLKPIIKGCIMVFIGILLTRIGIGVGRLTTNLIYGTLAFFFLAFSALVVIEIIRISEDPSYNSPITKKQAIVLFGVMNAIGLCLTVINVIVYYLSILSIVIAVSVGVLWLGLGLYAIKREKNDVIIKLIITLAFSVGIIYGATLNVLFIPVYVYSFFLTASFLQLSRENVKILNIGDRNKSPKLKMSSEERVKILKSSLILQLLAIVFLILPVFTNIMNPILYILPLVFGLIIIGLAAILTKKSISNQRDYKKLGFILKIGILVELIAFILAS